MEDICKFKRLLQKEDLVIGILDHLTTNQSKRHDHKSRGSRSCNTHHSGSHSHGGQRKPYQSSMSYCRTDNHDQLPARKVYCKNDGNRKDYSYYVAPRIVANAMRVTAITTSMMAAVMTAMDPKESSILKISRTERSRSRVLTRMKNAARTLPTRSRLAITTKLAIIGMTILSPKQAMAAAACSRTKVKAATTAARVPTTITPLYLTVIVMQPLMITLAGICPGRRRPQLPLRNLQLNSLL